MKKRKKAKRKITQRRQPLRPGARVRIKYRYHDYDGAMATVMDPAYESDAWGTSFWVRVKIDDNTHLCFFRKQLEDLPPDTKLAHDYYTLITGGLDAILEKV